MEENQLLLLIAKKLSGEASSAELALLDELLAKDGAASIRSEVITKIWDLPMENADATGKTETWNNINALMQQDATLTVATIPHKSFVGRKWLAAASVTGLVLIAGMVLYFISKTVPAARVLTQHEVVTENGSRSEMSLPDGSTVILNSGSRISYDKEFGTTNRRLSISGEAFFDVTHNPSLPFIVITREGTICVIGTAFNVRAYPDEPIFETSLLRGKIELELANAPGKRISLRPMEKIQVSVKASDTGSASTNRQLQAYTIKDIQKTIRDTFQLEEVSWIKHKYVFKAESFDTLARKIERWYGVKVIFAESSLKQKVFTGIFDDLSLEEALKALVFSSGNGFSYTIANNEVSIKR